jgi:chromate transporter
VGSISFGGHASLISVLQKELSAKKLLPDATVLEYFAMASILPGPVAVNVVTCLGYRLYGWLGAFLSMIAILLPSLVILSVIFLFSTKFLSVYAVTKAIQGVLPVVAAIILSTTYDLIAKQFHKVWQYVVFLIALVLLFINHSYASVLGYFLIGGFVGYFLEGQNTTAPARSFRFTVKPKLAVVICIGVCFMMAADLLFQRNDIAQLLAVFSRLSISMFGGGYIIIPVLKQIFVEHYNWINSAQFNQAIVYSQITPGPIMIVSTYIGFLKAGWVGAALATLGMFLPAGFLAIIVFSVYNKLENYRWFSSVPLGLRTVGVALMAYAGFVMLEPGLNNLNNLIEIFIFIISFIGIRFTKINYLIFMLLGGLLGIYL